MSKSEMESHCNMASAPPNEGIPVPLGEVSNKKSNKSGLLRRFWLKPALWTQSKPKARRWPPAAAWPNRKSSSQPGAWQPVRDSIDSWRRKAEARRGGAGPLPQAAQEGGEGGGGGGGRGRGE
jgi:hypothetical protein